MDEKWKSFGKIHPSIESLHQLDRAGQGPAVWMLVWSFEGERFAYIGQTAGDLFKRIKESTLKATQGNWQEFFRVDLTRKAGFADLYAIEAEGDEAKRNRLVQALEDKERAAGAIMLRKKSQANWPTPSDWPDWLIYYHARSILSAMNDHQREGKQLKGSDERDFEKLTIVLAKLQATTLSDDAVDDLDGDRPMRLAFSSMRYRRDPVVRRNVKERAKGKCELCGIEGFPQLDGTRYVECHHIIALANDGEDQVSNVIALCPGHHREAHFGQQAQQLEEKMIQVLQRLGVR